ncbi:MAG: radical SAM protein, partial [Pseudomonadota bacterium]
MNSRYAKIPSSLRYGKPRYRFRAIAPLKKSWAIQSPTTIGDDDELLDAMAAGGCFNVQVGFQSFNKDSLKWASVEHNRAEKYRELVGKLHDQKIIVTGFFIFGFDTDGPAAFDSTVEQAKFIDIDDANLYILTPYPGTPIYARFQREGRLLEGMRCTQFGWSHAVFHPKQMTYEELEHGVQRAYDMLYPFFRKRLRRVIFKRFSWILKHPRLIQVL